MNSINVIKYAGIVIGSIVMTAGLWGCQTGGLPDQPVAPDRQITLMDGGPHIGKADAAGAAVEYQYTRQSAPPAEVVLALEGRILSAPAESSMVNIYLLAVDRQGKVLAKDILYTSGYNNRYASRNPTFEKSVNLPPETMAFAFDSYIQQRNGDR